MDDRQDPNPFPFSDDDEEEDGNSAGQRERQPGDESGSELNSESDGTRDTEPVVKRQRVEIPKELVSLLPIELLPRISAARHGLSRQDLLSFCATNKTFNGVCESNYMIWKLQCELHGWVTPLRLSEYNRLSKVEPQMDETSTSRNAWRSFWDWGMERKMNTPAVKRALVDLNRDRMLNNDGLPNYNHGFYGHVTQWDTDYCTNMAGLFEEYPWFNAPIGAWRTHNITNMARMFFGAQQFNQPLNNWDVSHVETMESMFEYAKKFNQDLNQWNTLNVEDMSNLFKSASAFNGDLSTWNTRKVSTMRSMFQGATSFSGDLSNWSIEKCILFNNMFSGATRFNHDLSNWVMPLFSTATQMFQGATAFNADRATTRPRWVGVDCPYAQSC
jgi:surface protein